MLTRLQGDGRISLPQGMRLRHGWPIGQNFRIVEQADGLYLTPETPASVDDVLGCLKHSGTPATLEAMESAIEDELRERHAGH